MKLPKGKGTWPAFWMLPDPFTSWPDGGEIDIMEEVGYDPNNVLSTIHCGAYNGSNGKQKEMVLILLQPKQIFIYMQQNGLRII